MAGNHGAHPPGAGKSSFDLVDRRTVFDGVECQGKKVLDLGCGEGNYTILLSDEVGPDGKVYGVDPWEEGIALLRNKLAQRNIRNVETFVADAGQRLPLPDDSIDVCFIATVLHDLVHGGTAETALREMRRVMKDRAILEVIEFKKMDGPPGPPREIRMTPQDVERTIGSQGFRKESERETGPYTYRMLFSLIKRKKE